MRAENGSEARPPLFAADGDVLPLLPWNLAEVNAALGRKMFLKDCCLTQKAVVDPFEPIGHARCTHVRFSTANGRSAAHR